MITKKTLKTIYLVLIAFSFSSGLYANRIDSLQTDADVLKFLKSINKDFNTGKFELRSTEKLLKDLDCDGVAGKWQVKNWEKVDFNADNLTDLLIMPYWYDYGVYVIMDKGNGKFETLTLSYNIFEKCELAKSIDPGNGKGILYFQRQSKLKSKIDTLVYKYGNFVEYNSVPKSFQIDSVSFRTGYCFGSCPVFSITTDINGDAVYEAGSYNPKMGIFKTVIDPTIMSEIIGLINYIDVLKLKDDYKVSWTDDQTAWLRIRFSDGTVKEIKDYGLRGSFGLRLIYNKFFDLRSTQPWK